ncbi:MULTISPECIES: MFS transporter [Legionella]|uniref:Multidrug transporter MdfA n=1 Tax=Legionella maceachernii TaxID=466 RepID=A0A0W0W196_9GAMM|nr:MFS transporter [Legionella maceachernii]KTD26019.1 multidrug efflux system protein [Legionella maceachernii]SJZ50762.1 MFS transporter, DHA1 family, multidrug/chloramphenicol efflux transport protein [Legionella maceachernii]SUP03732.1 Chloramphenicol resistance pump Cmr [Legionella maceachernii]
MAQPLIPITRKQALVFACFLVLYEFLTYVANDMIMPGMLKVVESFKGPETAVATSLTAYILGGASLQLFLGPISDRYGRRPVMLSGALLFLLCTAAIACSNSIDQFLVARFFQGMGLCFIGVIGYATLQEIFAEMDAIRLIAIMANVSTIAPLLGPLLGAAFIHYFSWRLIFVLIGTFALFALWGLWRFMPEPIGQTKRDGQKIQRVSLAPRTVFNNYKNLFTNAPFMFGSIALGLMGLPCVAWIALAPVILIADAKLSVIQYGLWQVPLFGATIMGNWVLQRLTHRGTVKKILRLGSIILGVGLLASFILPFALSNSFIWLLPGFIIYFFGLGIAGAPLNRFILFCTPVGKGTTSALMSMIGMCTQAVGIEIANHLYQSHSNSLFGFYCALTGFAYFIFLTGALLLTKDNEKI